MCRANRGIVLGLYRTAPSLKLLEHALKIGVAGIDTAYNYAGFGSHRRLARSCADLLSAFTLSTKVGFFQRGEDVEHSLDPAKLRRAVEHTVDDLQTVPDVVFLHNPEQTLSRVGVPEGRDKLAAAMSMLAEATSSGLATSWGIASWSPLSLLAAVPERSEKMLSPPVLMVRAGLSVNSDVLGRAEELGRRREIGKSDRWGMSPFGGSTAERVWRTTNICLFLEPGQACSNLQAAFRVTFELPAVDRVAVGVSNKEHLDQLAAATSLRVNDEAISRYRGLIAPSRS